MAVITKSIGTTSRDYSTITAWEADLDNDTPYDAADDAVGECYADSDFTTTGEGGAITIDGGGTLGLNSVTLSVNSAERHDGTANSGVRLVQNSTISSVLSPIPIAGTDTCVIEWLEVDGNDDADTDVLINAQSAAAGRVPVVKNCLLHSVATAAANDGGIRAPTRDTRVQNTIVYSISTTGANRDTVGLDIDGDQSGGGIYNCTVALCVAHGTGNAVGIAIGTNSANSTVKNNISVGHGTTSGTVTDFSFPGTNPDSSNNWSEDETADDAGGTGHRIGSVHGQSETDLFVSVTGGSEDLHLKSGADAIDNGVDLVTTPTDVEIDIDGRDRDANGDTWDIGADEFVSVGAAGHPGWMMLQGIGI